MIDERLNRHIKQKYLGLRAENFQLKKWMEDMKSSLGRKDGEIVRLLNQIAFGIVKCS